MPKTVTKLYSNGRLAVNGRFDEVTKLINSIDPSTVYSSLFDEQSINGGGVAMRKKNDGSLLIGGIFDEYEFNFDSNLDLNDVPTIFLTNRQPEIRFNSDGSCEKFLGSWTSNGTWHSGTPTGANFEIRAKFVSDGGTGKSITAFGETLNNSLTLSNWYNLSVTRTISSTNKIFPGEQLTFIVEIRQIIIHSNISAKMMYFDGA